ncbi:MAG: hypothetical protein L3K14_02350 [Thermoplasmata archaeon]|nr:hypothetical protein [Thermoplasmata archaeon]
MTTRPGETSAVPYDLDASGAPLTESYEPPGVSGARIAGAVLLTIVYFLLIGYLPYYLEKYAARYGLSAAVSPTFLLVAGAVVAILAGLSIATKPTKAWGPVRVMAAGVDIIYIFYLLQNPIYSTTIHGFSITLAYTRILELFLIPPVIALIAGVVTTFGDIRHPGERVRMQFPQKAPRWHRRADGQAI